MKTPTRQDMAALQTAVDRCTRADEAARRVANHDAPFFIDVGGGVMVPILRAEAHRGADALRNEAQAVLRGVVAAFVVGLLESEAERDLFTIELQRWTP